MRHRSILQGLALTLALALALAACAPAGEEGAAGEEYGLWFAVRPGSGRSDLAAAVKEQRRWESPPGPAELMQALLDGPQDDSLYAPFPSGVVIRSVETAEETGTVLVDLSEQYGGLAGFELTLADYCIAMTLCQLPQVDTVEVTVEGKTIPYRDRQELRTGDVLLSGITQEPEVFLAVLYFPSRTGRSLTAEYRQVTRSGGSAVEIVVGELLRGPADQEESCPLPEGTRVLSLSVDGGVCQVDLSAEFVANAPPDQERASLVLYALVDSLCALGGVDQVRVSVEGQDLEAYGGVDTTAPLSAERGLVER